MQLEINKKNFESLSFHDKSIFFSIKYSERDAYYWTKEIVKRLSALIDEHNFMIFAKSAHSSTMKNYL